MANGESGWASREGRNFLFRYILSGFAALVLAITYIAISWPPAMEQLLAFAREASALTALLTILTVLLVGALLRGISIDRWEIFDRPVLKPWHEALAAHARRIATELGYEPGQGGGEDGAARPVATQNWAWNLLAGKIDPDDEQWKRGRAFWHVFQYDVLNSRGIDFFEGGFIWWANLVTLLLLFIPLLLLTVSGQTFTNGAPHPIASAVAVAVSLVLLRRAAGRMRSYFKNYMRVSVAALDRYVADERQKPSG